MTTPPDPLPTPPPPPAPERTVTRILIEGVFVALLGFLFLGVLWEAGFVDIGWTVAVIIWAGGTPLLEIIRVLQARG
jgi:hypothetical protein